MAAHYADLRTAYAKRMQFHGNGHGLFQPLDAHDLKPPSVGYFDRNGAWNLIANLETEHSPGLTEKTQVECGSKYPPLQPLVHLPPRVSDMTISWQPKTSLGVTATQIAAVGSTPDNLPGGADVHIQYATRARFGAMLMTKRPVTLHAYNDERLFLSWLRVNRDVLCAVHGAALRRYGLWIVTRTYNAPGCSIHAWKKDNKSAVVSLRAKASMLGQAGGEWSLDDQVFDKDWSHYCAKTPGDTLVLFIDGIYVHRHKWWTESIRQITLICFKAVRPKPSSSRPIKADANWTFL